MVVDDKTVGEIQHGLLVLVSVVTTDTQKDVDWTAAKLATLRVFRSVDGEKHFDQDVSQVGGSVLLVSNFTVAAETKKGRRPSLDNAAAPPKGRELFDALVVAMKNLNVPVATGEFAADMKITLANDGPATFIVDSAAAAKPSS